MNVNTHDDKLIYIYNIVCDCRIYSLHYNLFEYTSLYTTHMIIIIIIYIYICIYDTRENINRSYLKYKYHINT